MIFKDQLESISKEINPEFRRLINYAWLNQTYYTDLLLVHINGFYEPNIIKWNKSRKNKLNPHVIGPGSEGHSENTHYDFINNYRQQFLSDLPYQVYIKEFEWSEEKEKQTKIQTLMEIEETTIHLEMLIYLKIWEADLIIKKLYELTRIINGEHYDWSFQINESNRDCNSTGTRQEIIRKMIRNKLRPYSEKIFQLLRTSYITQLRNSIAHSKFSFQGRNIHLNNYIEGDQSSQLKTITFDNWIQIFHSTLVLYNSYIGINNSINDFYGKIATENDNVLLIRITEKDNKQYTLPIEYRPRWKDWNYKQIN